MNTKALATAIALAAMAAPAAAATAPDPIDELRDELLHEIDQVDREDMRVKSGVVNDGTLTLRVEDQKTSRGRKEIFGKNVDIDVSSLEESAEIAAGDAATLHQAIAHSDHNDQRLAEAAHHDDLLVLEQATYQDAAVFQAAVEHADHGDVAVAQAAAEADIAVIAAAAEADAAVAAGAQAYADAGDAATLAAANAHSDANDAVTLERAEAYADAGDDAVVRFAQEQHAAQAEELTRVLNESRIGHGQQAQQILGLQGQVDNVFGATQVNAFAINQLDGRITGVEQSVRDLEFALDRQRKAYRDAISGVTALSMVQQDPGADGIQASIGVGHFQGSNSAALVIGAKINDELYVNIGASSGAATAVGGSLTLRFK